MNCPKIPQMPQNLQNQIVCPCPKAWGFNEQMLHWPSVVRAQNHRKPLAIMLPPNLCEDRKVLFIGRYLYFLFYVILAINLPNYSLLGQPVINPIIDFRSWWKKEKKLGLEGACNLLCPVKLYKGIRLTLTQRVSKKKYTNGFRSGGNILGQSALKC